MPRAATTTCEEDPNCIINPAPDGDGDGVPEWDDCDDADPAIGAAPEGEECPEPPPPPLECEEDPDCEIIVNPAPDGDGDGVPEWDDCDDTDPEIGAALKARHVQSLRRHRLIEREGCPVTS